MQIQGKATRVTIYIGEGDRRHGKPLYMMLIEQLRQQGYAAPVLLRFPDIIKSRVDALFNAFQQAIENYGYEVLDLTLPAVVTADLRLNAPRYVTLPMMMKAKRKPQEVVQASALCPDLRAHVEVVGYEAPAAQEP